VHDRVVVLPGELDSMCQLHARILSDAGMRAFTAHICSSSSGDTDGTLDLHRFL
jgi:hypothetical protein